MKVQISLEDLDDLIYENDYQIIEGHPEGIQEQHYCVDALFGKAEMTVIQFEGVYINYGDIQLREATALNIKADFPVLEMHFTFGGQSFSSAKEYPTGVHFKQNQHNIMYAPSFHGKIEISTNSPLKAFEIGLSVPFFERLAAQNSDVSSKMLDQVNEKQPTLLSQCHLCITPEMKMLIFEIMNCKRAGYFKRLFIEAKVIELFLLQIEQLEQANHVKCQSIHRSDIDKLHEAKHIIESRMDNPPSLMNLSREVGLNDFKLKKGFKELFGTTVFGHLNALKMQQAKHLIKNKELTIAEVSASLGYKNATHFTAAFKRKFGITPSSIRN